MANIRAGDLNRRITIQRATVTIDALGGEAKAWADLATIWAAVKPISDGERWRAQEVAASATHRFTIRFQAASPKPTDRIVYEGRVFEISGVKELGFHEGWEVTASARAE